MARLTVRNKGTRRVNMKLTAPPASGLAALARR